MNKDILVNRIAHIVGCPRKEVLGVLKHFGMLSKDSNQPKRN